MLSKEEMLRSFIELVSHNSGYTGVAVFLMALAESLVVVGLFIPGMIAMSVFGALVSAGAIKLMPTILWAIIGAIVGDSISFSVGRKYKHKLIMYWPFRRFPHWLDRGNSFFLKHGSKSIVIGRFVGPVRPMIPVVAGIMSMCPRKFLLANIISAIIWAPLFICPGMGIPKIIVKGKNFFEWIK